MPQDMKFTPMCFLLEKVSMAAKCHRVVQSALVKKLIRKRRSSARVWTLFPGLARTLVVVLIAAVRGGDLLTVLMMKVLTRKRRSSARVWTLFPGLARTLEVVLIAAVRRGDLFTVPTT